MTIQDALQADRAGDFRQAAALYEQSLASQDARPDLFMNLALLYWQSTDPGQAAALHVTPESISHASRRSRELLAEAVQRFPGCTEARFWKRYVEWADSGEPLEVDWCRNLLDEDRSSLVPAMFVFSTSQGKKGGRNALDLLRLCHADGTARSRYVASVLESTILSALTR